MPLWATQGQRFERQRAIWAKNPTSNDSFMSKDQAAKFLEVEAQTLVTRYRPRSGTDMPSDAQAGPSSNNNLNLIMERCREFGDLDFNSATLQEEQERELSPEIEQERQVEKPAPIQAAKHRVHPDLKKFVTTGILEQGAKAYIPAFECFRDTSAASELNISQFPKDLLVTADFAKTVQLSGVFSLSDSYQRPVHWILTSIKRNGNIVKHIIVISPFEADELLPSIKESKDTTLSLYAPRQNLAFRPLDGLDLYNVLMRPEGLVVPQHLAIQLNLFAGQLYVDSFEDYVEVCKFLGLATDDSVPYGADGFILDGKATFKNSPVKFLKVLMTKIRRNCEGADKTHMGKIWTVRCFSQLILKIRRK